LLYCIEMIVANRSGDLFDHLRRLLRVVVVLECLYVFSASHDIVSVSIIIFSFCRIFKTKTKTKKRKRKRTKKSRKHRTNALTRRKLTFAIESAIFNNKIPDWKISSLFSLLLLRNCSNVSINGLFASVSSSAFSNFASCWKSFSA
jgi:hypothetical protein